MFANGANERRREKGKNLDVPILGGSGRKLAAAGVILKDERFVGHSLKSIAPSVWGRRMNFISPLYLFFSHSAVFVLPDFFRSHDGLFLASRP